MITLIPFYVYPHTRDMRVILVIQARFDGTWNDFDEVVAAERVTRVVRTPEMLTAETQAVNKATEYARQYDADDWRIVRREEYEYIRLAKEG